MLNQAALARASHAYRRGYQDGSLLQKPANTAERGTFGYHDYAKGHAAGLNDRYWSDHLAGNVTVSRDDFIKAYA